MDNVHFLLSFAFLLIVFIAAGLFVLWVEVKSSLKSTHQVTMLGTKKDDLKFQNLNPEDFGKDYFDNIN